MKVKNKNEKKIIKIKEIVFNTDIVVFVSLDWKECKKYIKKNYVKELYDQVDSVPEPKEGNDANMFLSVDFNNGFLWLRDFEPCPEHFSQLVHEVEHYVFHNLRMKGIKHTDDTDEVFAYYQQAIIKEFLIKLFSK